MTDEEMVYLYHTLDEHTQIVLSDHIHPRCGCSKPGVWQLQRHLCRDGGDLTLLSIAICPRCEATWVWGGP